MTPDLTKTSSYDYFLPKELIAQDPAEPRDSSRLFVVHKENGKTEDKIFRDIAEYLRCDDLLVMNDTRVLPARVSAVKINGNKDGAKVEIFFLNPTAIPNEWTALVRPGRKLPEGTQVMISDSVTVTVEKRLEDGLRTIIFDRNNDPLSVIHKYGQTPLPHYITDTHAEAERYQTVYAKAEKENSVAAPTAGLHFTPELLKKLEAKGVKHTFVTLQVGLGTFRPVKTENISQHIMHTEFCEIPKETAEAISKTKAAGGRVVAVGTTVVRTLESFAAKFGCIKSGTLSTNLFITPGFDFRVVDALITNFHLPMSTLLMLVSAFGGYDTLMNAYREAVSKHYRFFSFGDAMFIE
ncbi:MAG: tRNA preQ1(34) S-adenosylmethionine ribosyltransferase-isomerase QueA [Synergistes sp.]|nr:tRNA preQ1(34) S-adenosylmethionine ribosyltransferase-isomerase QueA [Synergistes sp.]